MLQGTLFLKRCDTEFLGCLRTSNVLLGITDSEIGFLDKVEDVEYEKRTGNVSLIVLLGITDSELGLLHKVEDIEYEKSTVNASLYFKSCNSCDFSWSQQLLAVTQFWCQNRLKVSTENLQRKFRHCKKQQHRLS
ncbi:uncharacterized protein LOC113293004 [Papaver somniferum]|uniref:uncharacterized protein LOC113293004 n=1 Tax=Papaver somniferum TaxID=3469 RepID=UPI000E6F541A|nr:uncharacterized protein LOC113293004 [Papaver somniferum]